MSRWTIAWEMCKRKSNLIYEKEDIYVNIKISKEKHPKTHSKQKVSCEMIEIFSF